MRPLIKSPSSSSDLLNRLADIFEAEADECATSAGSNPSPTAEAFTAIGAVCTDLAAKIRAEIAPP